MEGKSILGRENYLEQGPTMLAYWRNGKETSVILDEAQGENGVSLAFYTLMVRVFFKLFIKLREKVIYPSKRFMY